MPGPLKLVGAGRHADVYDLGDGRVLRRYRDAAAMADREAEVMVHALSHGVPVPEVFDVSGADMVMEHAVGLTMLQDITRRPWALDRHARLLAALHSTVHAVPALNWLRAPFGDGTVLLHTDLHPGNVILTKAGPRLIDWQGAARGPAEADIALTWVLVATSQVPGPLVQRAVGRAGQALFARRYLAAAQPGAGLGLAGAPLPRRAAGAVPRPAGRSFRPPSPAVGVNSRVHGGHRATAAAPTIVSFGLCQLCAQA